MTWHHLDTLLTRIRPHRESLALVIDALMIAACWNITYLFRLGFERWQNARPDYDGWVLIGVIAVYLSVFVLLKVPKGMWRFSGFGEIQRLTIACGIAGMVTAVGVLMAQLVQVPRAVLGLHPVISLMGWRWCASATGCSMNTCAGAFPARCTRRAAPWSWVRAMRPSC